MLRFAVVSLALAGALSATTVQADEAKVRAAIQSLVPNAKIDSFADAAMPGYSEVSIGGNIVYVSNDGKYLIQGSVFDITTKTDLTEKRRADTRKVELAKVPVEKRIRFKAKEEKHRVTVFTDIDCGYCRKLHQEMAQYNDLGITVDYLFFPRAGLNSPSFTKAVNVWCAADKQSAMTDAKNGKEVPAKTCANPIAEDYALGQKVGVNGTPAIFTDDGTQLGGYVPAASLLERLNSKVSVGR